MVDIELEQTVFQIEHGLRGERSGASGGEVERRSGQKHGMRSSIWRRAWGGGGGSDMMEGIATAFLYQNCAFRAQIPSL